MGEEKETLKKLSPEDIKEEYFSATESELSNTQEIKINIKNIKLLKYMSNPSRKQKKRDYTILPANIERFKPHLTKGLDNYQVDQRKREGLTNSTKDTTTRTYREIFFKNIFNFLNILIFSIATVLIVFKKYSQAFFVWVAIANIIISIVQEIKAKRTIEKLKLVTSQNVKVIREGNMIVIPSQDLVLDDIFVLSNGDQIPTDAVILNGEIEVNESLLTGESLPVKKKVGHLIYAGSFIISGSVIVRASSIGNYNYALGLQAKAKEYKKINSELVTSLNKLIKGIGLIIIPLGISLFFTQFFLSPDVTKLVNTYDRLSRSFSYTAGSLVGMIPSGMYLLTSVALSTGVISLSRKQTLVQDIYCIEMLSRTTTLCLDKTGTLTDGTMQCAEYKLLKKDIDLTRLMGSYLGAFNESNQTSIALSKSFPILNDYIILDKVPFSSERKYSKVTFKDFGTFVLGAPEYIHKFSKSKSEVELEKYIYEKQIKGFRVVMLAQCKNEDSDNKLSTTPIAIFVIEDHIREDAPGTIDWFVKNHVKIKIISGDNPLTVSEIAKKCGVPDSEKAVSLEGLSADDVALLVKDYTIFGRVSPEQKAIIVKELKKQGETVAMTGDGVNDILAMKNADCSIAMANGSSSTKNIAHLVLLDSNFSHMPEVVAEGRRVINNIQRSSSLFLMKTLFSVVFTIVVLFTYIPAPHQGISYPLQTNNIMIMEIAGIGLPSVLLALQKNNAEIKGHFVRNTLSRSIPGAICLILVISLAYIFKSNNLLGFANIGNLKLAQGVAPENLHFIEDESFTTFCSLLVTFVSLAMVFNCCIPLNSYRGLILSLSFIAAAIMIFVFPFIDPFNNSAITIDSESNALNNNITRNISTQFIGIDFRYLTLNESLILVISFIIGIPLLTFLISVFSFMRGEKFSKVQLIDKKKPYKILSETVDDIIENNIVLK